MRVLDDMRAWPNSAGGELPELSRILASTSRQLSEKCLRAVLGLNDEYHVKGQTHVGFRVGRYANEEIPEYEEYTTTYDFRPLKRLAAAELARRS